MQKLLHTGVAGSGPWRTRCWPVCGLMVAVLLLSWIDPLQGWTAEWSLQPSIATKGLYNSNLVLTPFPHEPTYGYWVSPAAEFAGKTERLVVSSRVAADFVSYYGGEETRFTNIYLPLTLRYKTETDALDFTGGFVRDNTLMSELLTTGVVLRFTQRNQWTANPSWTRYLTEKLAFQSSFQFSDTTYENGLRLGLVDYQLFGGSGGLSYQVTEQDQIQLSGVYFNFHTFNAPFMLRATFPGAMLNVTHAFTESLSANVYGGPRFVDATTRSAGDTVKTNETVWVFGAAATKKFERATVQANLSRDIFPSGFGLLIRTDRAGVSMSYDLSERVSAGLDASGYIVSGITTRPGGATFPKILYLIATPRVSWRFLEWWKVDLSYTFGRSDFEGFAPATSNATMLMLTYYPPKFSSSK